MLLLLSIEGPSLGLAFKSLPFLLGGGCWLLRLVILNDNFLQLMSNCPLSKHSTALADIRDKWLLQFSSDIFYVLSRGTVYMFIIYAILDFEQFGEAARFTKFSSIARFLLFRIHCELT